MTTPGEKKDAATETSIKGQALTLGGLLLLVVIAYAGLQAATAVSDRAAAGRRSAIAIHDHDERSHPSIKRTIEAQGRTLKTQIEGVRLEVRGELREIKTLILRQGRRRR